MNKSALSLTAALALQAACTPAPKPTPVINLTIPTPPDTIPTVEVVEQIPAPVIAPASKLTSEMMADIRWKCQQITPYLSCSHEELVLFSQIQKKYPAMVDSCKLDNDWDLNCTDRLFQDSYISIDKDIELYQAVRAQCSYMFQKCVVDEMSRGTDW
jgi:hypothetical protein